VDGAWSAVGEGVDISTASDAFGGFSNDDNLLSVTVKVTPVQELVFSDSFED